MNNNINDFQIKNELTEEEKKKNASEYGLRSLFALIIYYLIAIPWMISMSKHEGSEGAADGYVYFLLLLLAIPVTIYSFTKAYDSYKLCKTPLSIICFVLIAPLVLPIILFIILMIISAIKSKI